MATSKDYSPEKIASWFLASIDREAGDSITHLKLQKLAYYAQAWALVILGHPLFEEDFQAWTHGPVLPSLYKKYGGNGWDALPAPESLPDIEDDAVTVLTEVKCIYGELSAKHLENLTHQEQPWREARGNLALEARCTNVIKKTVMKAFYTDVYNNPDAAIKLPKKHEIDRESLFNSILSQEALAKVWDTPEEDEAWRNL